jgi:hypothetical protein
VETLFKGEEMTQQKQKKSYRDLQRDLKKAEEQFLGIARTNQLHFELITYLGARLYILDQKDDIFTNGSIQEPVLKHIIRTAEDMIRKKKGDKDGNTQHGSDGSSEGV